uniref:Uncharacterized protein n=1 Tax=Chenopodium quinoa TaxID=63459 RepID=A0A803MFC8_CHEQI
MLFMSQFTLSSSVQHDDEHALSYAVTSSISSSKATNDVDDNNNSRRLYSSNTRKLAVMFRGSPRFIPAVVANRSRTSDASNLHSSLLLLPLLAYFFL